MPLVVNEIRKGHKVVVTVHPETLCIIHTYAQSVCSVARLHDRADKTDMFLVWQQKVQPRMGLAAVT